MKPGRVLIISLLIILCVGVKSNGQVIIATETENGVYENGKYRSSPPEYISHFLLDEKEKKLPALNWLESQAVISFQMIPNTR